MSKFLLSGLICFVVLSCFRSFSDTFASGTFATILYVHLDIYFVEGRRA